MSKAGEPYARPRTQEEQSTDALKRYRERRIAEIRAGSPLPEKGFIPLDRLRELADGTETGESGTLGS
jgi:hypothetical protein